jgi:hypothetical protein
MIVPHRKRTNRHPQPVTGTPLLFISRSWWYLTGNTPTGLHILLRVQLGVSYVDDVRTSQETRLWASMAYYSDVFTFLYVDDVRTSQEILLCASTVCYGDSFTFLYVDDVHRTMKKREKWVVVRDTTGGGNRIYHRFWRFPGIARLSFW